MFSQTDLPAEMEDGPNDNDDTLQQDSEKQSATTSKSPSKWEKPKKLLGEVISLKQKAKEDRSQEYHFGQDVAKSHSRVRLDARTMVKAKEYLRRQGNIKTVEKGRDHQYGSACRYHS
ncbi:hypothetical protein PoB_006074900 [Plakobranchus ocellatus]|uniref:Uncharacterized protein n=1 Tax=Plakobranchus ocellatus TaxID=259542 RepID=A0AAV4CQV8_9GAST|nr:hypothetical protein PoB_006074900 [Plakobranchus ocellatus]